MKLARILLLAIACLGLPGLCRAQPEAENQCLDDNLMPLFTAHRFAELEIELKRRLQQAEASGDVHGRICARHFLGGVQGRLEKYDEALANLRRALAEGIRDLPPEHTQILDTREILAAMLGSSGDRAGEIRAFTELLPIYEQRYGAISEKTATLLRNLATAHSWVGDYPEVVRLDRRVLAIKLRLAETSVAEFWRKNRNPALARARLHLAEGLLRLPDGGREALQLAEQALPEMMALLGADHPDVLNGQLVQAMAKAALNDLAGARAIEEATLHAAGLKLGDGHPVTRKARNNLAVRLAATGQAGAAIRLDRGQLDELLASKGGGHPETLLSYGNLASKLVQDRNYDEAIKVAEEGLRGMLALRASLAFDARLVAAWQGSMRQMVESYLIALVASRRHDDAFLAAEFFKSRLLADRLALNGEEMRLSGAERKRYRAALLELARIEQELAARHSLRQPTDELEARRLGAEERVRAVLAGRNGQTAAEAIPSSRALPPWAGMVQVLSDEQTAYVSLVRLAGQVFAFSFLPDGRLLTARIAPAARLRALLAASRQLILNQGRPGPIAVKVWQSGDQYRLAARGREDESEVTAPDALLEELSGLILKRLEPALAGRRNIVFSPDDLMAHVPFAALPYQGKPLAGHFSVAMVPSLETLIQARARSAKDPAGKPVLAFGGARYQRIEQVTPLIYVRHEEETKLQLMDYKAIRQQVAADPKRLPVALASVALGPRNLPGSEAEARMAVAALGGVAADGRVVTGQRATEASWNALAERGELGQYRVIHLAAHGFLSDDDPALSAVVLGQVQREPGTDGYLTAAELSAVELHSDLVVVSACDSGVSGLIEGEGMRGLASALFEAGTRHALLTLWPINDKATVRFMERFYRHYRAGDTPAAALVAAQRWAIEEGWPARDWAAFVLHGN
jgi:CHAT domain-containing protein